MTSLIGIKALVVAVVIYLLELNIIQSKNLVETGKIMYQLIDSMDSHYYAIVFTRMREQELLLALFSCYYYYCYLLLLN